jgi:hypothetical protein
MGSRYSFSWVIIKLLIIKSDFVFAQMDPLTHWTFGDSTFYYSSGLMDLTNSSYSLTVFLTNQEISCSNVPIAPNGKSGAWIEVKFPDLTINNYNLGEIWGTMSCYIFGSYWKSYTGYLGSAGITSIDTIEKRIQGWIEFETDAFDFPLSANGSFIIPYCLPIINSLPEISYDKLQNSFELHQNYPNPFNPKTVISWQLASGSEVELSIYNLFGQKVATLVSKRQPAGKYQVEWDASAFASGVYFYKIRASQFNQIRKMLVIK